MAKILAALFFVISVCILASGQDGRSGALERVVAAENNFADAAVKDGTRAAFLRFAADNGLVFTDKPENAKENWQKRPTNATFLDWRPSWADVSASGDLGYTTGTWAFSRTKAEAPAAWGEYFTIWQKQPDGSWKFALDLGIGHDKADVIKNNWRSPVVAGKTPAGKSSADKWTTLETSFVDSMTKNGAGKTYEKLASDQVRLLIDGKMPFQGKIDALSHIANVEIKTKPLGGGASSNMAYAYGEYDLKAVDGKTEKGFYARVWKLEAKGWRIAAEVRHPVPPPKS